MIKDASIAIEFTVDRLKELAAEAREHRDNATRPEAAAYWRGVHDGLARAVTVVKHKGL